MGWPRWLSAPSSADANVFWHAGKILALAESGLPQQFSRALEPEEFDGGLTSPSPRTSTGTPPPGAGSSSGWSPPPRPPPRPAHRRLGRVRRAHPASRSSWNGPPGSTTSGSRPATWSSSSRLPSSPRPSWPGPTARGAGTPRRPVSLDTRCPGVGVVDREADGSGVRWMRHDPCLVTHVLHAHDEGDAVVLYVCRYEVPERGSRSTWTSRWWAPPGSG